jgi:hypothetical protein
MYRVYIILTNSPLYICTVNIKVSQDYPTLTTATTKIAKFSMYKLHMSIDIDSTVYLYTYIEPIPQTSIYSGLGIFRFYVCIPYTYTCRILRLRNTLLTGIVPVLLLREMLSEFSTSRSKGVLLGALCTYCTRSTEYKYLFVLVHT